MFRFRLWMAGLIALALALTLAVAAYTSKAKPKYVLLLFDPEAKTRVLVVQDGETLYVDRNGDGDPTGKDERFTLKFANGHGSVGDCNIEIRDADKKTRYVITSISIYPENDKPDAPPHLMANVDTAESLAMLLKLYGHEVWPVHTGPKALEVALAERPDVILLDIGLPGMDGYEVARRLREQMGLEGVRLIAMTGYGQEADRRRSQDAGSARRSRTTSARAAAFAEPQQFENWISEKWIPAARRRSC